MDITPPEIEEWKPIAGWEEFYAVSNWGRVRRLRPRIRGDGISQGRPDKYGYWRMTLANGRQNMQEIYVHVMVANLFIGERPDGLIVNHRDGIKSHNWSTNLEWVTYSRNMLHALEMGLRSSADNGKAKLTDEDVQAIRTMDGTQAAIAARFNVHQSEISRIRGGKVWTRNGPAHK